MEFRLKTSSVCLKSIAFLCHSLVFAASAQALETTITLVPDDTITPTANEVVTFGLPLAAGVVTDINQLCVTLGGEEQPISVEAGLRWHWTDNSLRSVTIQLQHVDMTGGEVKLLVTDCDNMAGFVEPLPHSNGWASAPANKARMPFPRIFALHDREYIAGTNLIPPYIPGNTESGIGMLQADQFDSGYGDLDFSNGSGGAQASFLFDRATAMFKAYLNTGELKFLKEGFLTKQFYFSHVRNDGAEPAQAGGDGCWTFASTACADGKYIYTEPAKLALALFGDKSQWDEALIVEMATQADLGWNQHASSDLYDAENEGFTERAAGLTGLAEINAWEITGDQSVLATMNARIRSLKDMQQTVKAWDRRYGWTPKSGAFTHSWSRHEGSSFPGSGSSDDRRFSPWMSENIADFLWHVHHVFEGDDSLLSVSVAEVGEMLRLLGNAIELYGFTSSYIGGNGLDAQYATKEGLKTIYIACSTWDNEPISLLYSGSAYASAAALARTADGDGGYADLHNVELLLPLSLALYFETDSVAKERLLARIMNIQFQWFNFLPRDCASIFNPGNFRLFNWQHRSNSGATADWVLAQ